MIKQIDIHQFKAFQHLKIVTLRQVNLIVGANNVGKTALLEAVDLAATCRTDKSLHGEFRDPIVETSAKAGDRDWVHYIVPIGALDNKSSVGVLWERGWSGMAFGGIEPEWFKAPVSRIMGSSLGQRAIMMSQPDPAVPVVRAGAWPVNPTALNGVFDTALLRSDMEARIETWIRELDPRIVSIRSQKPVDRIRQIYVDIGAPQKIPLVQLGQGAQKLVMLASKAALAEGGVLLVDEIDVGFHHGYLERLWQAVFAMARDLKVQVFATTHSYECIKAAAKVASQIEGDQLALHRLERHGADIRCITGTEDTLVAAMEAGFEVR